MENASMMPTTYKINAESSLQNQQYFQSQLFLLEIMIVLLTWFPALEELLSIQTRDG